MSTVDIFIAILSAVILFGGMYLNIKSRRLADEYAQAHKPQIVSGKTPVKANINSQKKKV